MSSHKPNKSHGVRIISNSQGPPTTTRSLSLDDTTGGPLSVSMSTIANSSGAGSGGRRRISRKKSPSALPGIDDEDSFSTSFDSSASESDTLSASSQASDTNTNATATTANSLVTDASSRSDRDKMHMSSSGGYSQIELTGNQSRSPSPPRGGRQSVILSDSGVSYLSVDDSGAQNSSASASPSPRSAVSVSGEGKKSSRRGKTHRSKSQRAKKARSASSKRSTSNAIDAGINERPSRRHRALSTPRKPPSSVNARGGSRSSSATATTPPTPHAHSSSARNEREPRLRTSSSSQPNARITSPPYSPRSVPAISRYAMRVSPGSTPRSRDDDVEVERGLLFPSLTDTVDSLYTVTTGYRHSDLEEFLITQRSLASASMKLCAAEDLLRQKMHHFQQVVSRVREELTEIACGGRPSSPFRGEFGSGSDELAFSEGDEKPLSTASSGSAPSLPTPTSSPSLPLASSRILNSSGPSSGPSITAGTSSGAGPADKAVAFTKPKRRFYSDQRYALARANAAVYSSFNEIVDTMATFARESTKIDFASPVLQCPPRVLRLWQKYFPFKRIALWDEFLGCFYGGNVPLSHQKSMKLVVDPFQTESVSLSTFSKLSATFGAVEGWPAECHRLIQTPWFYAFLDFPIVKKLLEGEPIGSFLVRFHGGRADSFCLVHKVSQTQLVSHKIEVGEKGTVKLKNPDNSLDKKLKSTYDSLYNFVKRFQKRFQATPFVLDLFRKPYFHPRIASAADAASRLADLPVGTFVVYFSPDLEHSLYSCTFLKTSDRGVDTNTISLCFASLPGQESIFEVVGLGSQYTSIDEFVKKTPFLKYNFAHDHIPTLDFVNFEPSTNALEELFGPVEIDKGVRLESGSHLVCAETISTYPKESIGSRVMCDSFYWKCLGNRTALTLCDGCGWGLKSRSAAQTAAKAFVNHLSSRYFHFVANNAMAVKDGLQKALQSSHEAILSSVDHYSAAGLTTLVGGLLLQINNTLGTWAFMSVSVGDAKTYIYRPGSGVVIDVTKSNRVSAIDASDPGGKLGPAHDDQPDLRNLKFYFTPCRPGDVLFLCSDGVHDNLDPEHQGLSPSMLNGHVSSAVEWKDLPPLTATAMKEKFKMSILQKILKGTTGEPSSVVTALMSYCKQLTEKTRTYMEMKGNGGQEPKDYCLYPGKMDHTTVVAVKIPARRTSTPRAFFPSQLVHRDSRTFDDLEIKLRSEQRPRPLLSRRRSLDERSISQSLLSIQKSGSGSRSGTPRSSPNASSPAVRRLGQNSGFMSVEQGGAGPRHGQLQAQRATSPSSPRDLVNAIGVSSTSQPSMDAPTPTSSSLSPPLSTSVSPTASSTASPIRVRKEEAEDAISKEFSRIFDFDIVLGTFSRYLQGVGILSVLSLYQKLIKKKGLAQSLELQFRTVLSSLPDSLRGYGAKGTALLKHAQSSERLSETITIFLTDFLSIMFTDYRASNNFGILAGAQTNWSRSPPSSISNNPIALAGRGNRKRPASNPFPPALSTGKLTLPFKSLFLKGDKDKKEKDREREKEKEREREREREKEKEKERERERERVREQRETLEVDFEEEQRASQHEAGEREGFREREADSEWGSSYMREDGDGSLDADHVTFGGRKKSVDGEKMKRLRRKKEKEEKKEKKDKEKEREKERDDEEKEKESKPKIRLKQRAEREKSGGLSPRKVSGTKESLKLKRRKEEEREEETARERQRERERERVEGERVEKERCVLDQEKRGGKVDSDNLEQIALIEVLEDENEKEKEKEEKEEKEEKDSSFRFLPRGSAVLRSFQKYLKSQGLASLWNIYYDMKRVDDKGLSPRGDFLEYAAEIARVCRGFESHFKDHSRIVLLEAKVKRGDIHDYIFSPLRKDVAAILEVVYQSFLRETTLLKSQ